MKLSEYRERLARADLVGTICWFSIKSGLCASSPVAAMRGDAGQVRTRLGTTTDKETK